MRTTTASRRRRAGGLTLLEVVVALGILAVGLLSMLAMQIHALQQGRVGRDVTEAAMIAQQQMENLHRIAWAAAAPVPWQAPQAVNGATTGGGGPGAQLAQVFNLTWRIQATADPNVRLVDVQVTWAEPNDPPGAPPRRYAMSTARHDDP